MRCPCRRKKKVSLLYGPMQSKWIIKVMWHCTGIALLHSCAIAISQVLNVNQWSQLGHSSEFSSAPLFWMIDFFIQR